jgi:hypothetical protein
MQITDKDHPASCHSCLTAKQHRTSQKHAIHANINKFGDLFSCDLNGAPSMPPTIANGAHCLLTMTDCATKATFVRLIKHKSDASAEVIKFCKFIYTQFGIKIKRWLSDGGTEFNKAKAYCEKEGMLWGPTQAYASDMNGGAEKVGGDIMRRGFAILHDAGLPMTLWGLCMEAANYLRNRSPNASLGGKTPYEALYNVKPDVSHLRIIGSLVYTHVSKEKRLKHESHTNRGIFVGYTDTDRLVKVYDPYKRTVKTYRDVVIDETLRWSTCPP